MQIARPPNGFRIALAPPVAAAVEAAKEEWPRFAQYWQDVIGRLKFVAHREGVLDERLGPGHRMFVAEGLKDAGLPRVCLVYLVLGDTVRIRLARFS